MKAIICAGGMGTRLAPLSLGISKHLLPVYDKPMIYYPISIAMLAGIKNILIMVKSIDLPNYKNLLGTGAHLGINIEYVIQDQPKGLVEALILGSDFIENDNCLLLLGDNLFYGQGLLDILKQGVQNFTRPKIFLQRVTEPKHFGVAEIDTNNQIRGLEEKPENPKSDLAITGMYILDRNASSYAKQLKISKRNELEIIDLLQYYLDREELEAEVLGRGIVWLDMGDPDRLLEAAQFVRSLENKQGFKVACLEEIALNSKFISAESAKNLEILKSENKYSGFIKSLLERELPTLPIVNQNDV